MTMLQRVIIARDKHNILIIQDALVQDSALRCTKIVFPK
jgi:hypothetical protein